MSPKAKPKSPQPKKTAAAPKAAGKQKPLGGKKGKDAAQAEVASPPSEGVDPEEAEEAAEEAAAASNGTGGNAAALAAASGSGEMSASFKNFRHHPDMENFYRFIFENDLRHEALAILDTMMADKHAKKAVKIAGGKSAQK